MKELIFITIILLLSKTNFAQGLLWGKVWDEKKTPLFAATIRAYQNNVLKGSFVTDTNGEYTINPLEPGKYNVLVLQEGYDSLMMSDVLISQNMMTTVHFKMSKLGSNNKRRKSVNVCHLWDQNK